MQTNEIQELLLDTIPAWHYWFARPFKRMLNDGVSLDMYYCIQSMRRSGHTMTMTELANFARMPKQQMSKLVDRLVDGGFAERLSDPDDRRVIRLRATAKADEYIAAFFEKDAAEYREFFEQLDKEELDPFCEALRTIHDTFDEQRKRTDGKKKIADRGERRTGHGAGGQKAVRTGRGIPQAQADEGDDAAAQINITVVPCDEALTAGRGGSSHGASSLCGVEPPVTSAGWRRRCSTSRCARRCRWWQGSH